MLELQHRLVRQAIEIAISKAMDDMRGNTKRSIRNLIDLGLLFAKSENQKWFFHMAKQIISNPNNPYNTLVARMITNINNDTIKAVGLNLGYNSLIYGLRKLQKCQDSLGINLPWLLLLNYTQSGPAVWLKTERLIKEGRELGIYSYILCTHDEDNIAAICRIANKYPECLFIIKIPCNMITDQNAELLGSIHHVAVCLQLSDADLSSGENRFAFQILKKNKCLYGITANYNTVNVSEVTSSKYIGEAISGGNLFCVYLAEHDVLKAQEDAVYTFVCRERGKYGQAIITLDWFTDMQYIDKKNQTCGYMPIDLTEQKTAGNLRNDSLLKRIMSMQPCTNS